MQSIDDLVQSYLSNTQFYGLIRNRLKTMLSQKNASSMPYISQKHLDEVVKGNHYVLRSEPDFVKVQFEFVPLLVVIYGEMEVKGRRVHKGQYFEHTIPDHNLQQQRHNPETPAVTFQVKYIKSTTVVVINLDVFNHRIKRISDIIYKQYLIELLLPTKYLKLTKSQIRKLSAVLTFQKMHEKFSFSRHESGLFIFISGVFQILHQLNSVLEVEKTFIEISEKKEFTVRLKSCQGLYGYLQMEKVKEIVSSESSLLFEKLWRQRQNIKKNEKIVKDYQDDRKKTREKFKGILQKNKACSRKNIRFNSTARESSLEVARATLLSKCATPVTTSRSLSTPKMKKSSNSWSSRYEKKVESYNAETNFQKKYERTMSQSLQKLGRLRKYQKLKGYGKLTTQLWLDPKALEKSKTMTYFQIKQDHSKSECLSMTNFKRLFRVNQKKLLKTEYSFR